MLVMARMLQLAGQRFERLTVKEFAGFRDVGKHGRRNPMWRCLCDCGAVSVVSTNALKNRTKSCGCLNREWQHTFSQSTKTHGQRHTRTYNVWATMRQRCSNPNHCQFADYGGRGITVCERWEKFDNFLADMGHAPDGLSIERIDNHGNYEPTNCKWATREEQGRNRRSNVLLTLNGRSMIAADWADEIGMPASSLLRRLDIGWSEHRALTTPLRAPNRGTKRFDSSRQYI